jgi:magnesium-transporting ATPase (P-type)
MFRARVIWPEHPTLLTVILFLFAVSSVVMLVDTIRRGRPLRRPRGSSPLRVVLMVIAVITTFLALVGLLYIISPWLFINLMRLLPTSIQEWMLMDFVLRGTGFWIFAIVSGILWYIISRKR